ncbi:unnamed protein product (mitochondrion) [Plasmodiophora brassicae]|uniref:N-acetyltransferase domain-containing protein n=1 Tax=Plasmodiophora brassicae TaxID=37360 RepID=A0A3P3YIE6_PLABS|nr:unnamed protein product [Plasmodiophora brassicae]
MTSRPPRSVPWADYQEWRRVYANAFSSDVSDRMDAVAQIAVWRSRGHLPIAADVTGVLLELDDACRTGSMSPLALRFAISMAAVRLVNGLTDREQTSLFAKPVRDVAAALGIPISFVEVRHLATHNELPSLFLALQVKDQALDFLRSTYWQVEEEHQQALWSRSQRALSDFAAAARLGSRADTARAGLHEVVRLVAEQSPPQRCTELSDSAVNALWSERVATWAPILDLLSKRSLCVFDDLSGRLLDLIGDTECDQWRRALYTLANTSAATAHLMAVEYRFFSARESASRDLYDKERALRFEWLRKPLGGEHAAKGEAEEFPFEKDSVHLVATMDGNVIGCVLFHPDGRGSGRLFQMAVDERYRGRGIGAQLVRRLEQHLRDIGLTEVTLHAREYAAGFYRTLGYEQYGDPFEEVGIPHCHMRRTLL